MKQSKPSNNHASRPIASISSLPPRRDKYDVFLSHNWGTNSDGVDNHNKISLLNSYLHSKGIVSWFDQQDIGGDVPLSISHGIDNSTLFIACLTTQYVAKVCGDNCDDFCQQEFRYARKRRGGTKMIPIVMEHSVRNQNTWTGPVGMCLGDHLYWDMTADPMKNETVFIQQMEAIYCHLHFILNCQESRTHKSGDDLGTFVPLRQLSVQDVGLLLENLDDLKKYSVSFLREGISGLVLSNCSKYEDIISELGIVKVTTPRAKLLFDKIVSFKMSGVPIGLLKPITSS
jgi:hypothetical protein